MKLYPHLGAYFSNEDIMVKSSENLVIESRKMVEVRVYHPNLENDKSYLFHLDI